MDSPSSQIQMLREYKLLERIGSGGFGAVYRASQSSIEREVAIKVILPTYARQPDFVRRFETEAQLVARLEHMNIVPLFDYWRDPDGAYLVMRYLRGGSLRDQLTAQAYSLEAAGALLSQITAALATAHRHNVIHRDIKPANILLDEEGNAYLTDFGIAKDYSNIDGAVTDGDVVVGSPDYISPEQARGEPVTPRTDIYSLGVVLYELLVGQHPFPNISAVERMYKHLSERLPTIPDLVGRAAQAVDEVIQQATAKDPANRYGDVLEFTNAFFVAARLNQPQAVDNVVALLTPREQEILQLMIDGLTNQDIADQLVVAISTVKWHQRQIYSKLRVRNRVQAIMRARELDLVYGSSQADDPPTVLGHTSSIARLPEPDNPYKGLQPFQSADSQDFFGRNNLIEKLISRLSENSNRSRFMAIVGPSGSGKSSLVNAGLVPALWRGDLPGSDRWFITHMLPGDEPLDELEVALRRVATNLVDDLPEQLRRDGRGLRRATHMLLPDDRSELVLIIDQFEELFTLTEDEVARSHFLDLIYDAVSAPHSRTRVIVTLRADFYDRPLRYPEFGEIFRGHMETVLPLSAQELEQAIVSPARRVNVTFEEGLVASIVGEVNYQAGALPLLQYALTELFERREGRMLTRQAYQEIGGTVGALAKRADQIFLEYDQDGQAVIRQVFLRLVTLGEGVEDTRRRVTLSELSAIVDNDDLLEDILDTFVSYRLLSLDHDPDTRRPTVEVAHEAILREWKRLQEWLEGGRNDIRQQRMLAAAARDWRNAGRDSSYLLRGTRLTQFEEWAQTTSIGLTKTEQDFLAESAHEHERQAQREAEQQAHELALQRQAAQRLRFLVAALTLFLIVAAGLSLFAFGQQNRAEDALALSEQRGTEVAAQRDQAVSRNQADIVRRLLEQGDTDLALSVALEAVNMENPPSVAQEMLGRAANAASHRTLKGHTEWVMGVTLNPVPVEINDTAYSAGQLALSTSRDRTTRLWDVATGETLSVFDVEIGGATDVAFSPTPLEIDGTTYAASQLAIFSGGLVYNLHLRDLATGEILRVFEGHTHVIRKPVFSPAPLEIDDMTYAHGQLVLSASEDQTMRLWDVNTGQTLRVYEGHTGPLDDADLSPAPLEIDGMPYATGELALSASRDGTMRLWDLVTGETLRVYKGHSSRVYRAAFSPAPLEIKGTAYATGQLALSASEDKTLRLWDVTTGETLRVFEGHTDLVWMSAFAPDGQTAVSGSNDGTLRLWDVATGETLRVLVGHNSPIGGIYFSPSGQFVLSGSDDTTLRLWDVATNESLRVYEGTTHPLGEDVALSSQPLEASGTPYGDGQLALSGFDNLPVRLWDVDTGEILREFEGQISLESGFAYSETPYDSSTTSYGRGTLSLIVTPDRTMFLKDSNSLEFLRAFEGYASAMRDVAFSLGPLDINGSSYAQGQLALTAGGDGSLRLWNVTTGETLHVYEGHAEFVRSAAFNPAPLEINGAAYDSSQLALSASGDGTLRLWDMASGESLRVFEGHSSGLFDVAFAPDGQTALSASDDRTLRLWDMVTGEALSVFEGHTGSVFSIAFSFDGKTALSASGDGTLRLWDTATSESLHIFEGHTQPVRSVVFNPAPLEIDGTAYAPGQLALSASDDHTLRLWDVATGETLRVFEGHTDLVSSVAFSQDGQTALSGSFDRTLRLWDVASGETLRVFEGHTSLVRAVAFSPTSLDIGGDNYDPGQLALSVDHTLRLWRIDTLNDLIAFVHDNRQIHPLTCDERRRFFARAQCDEAGNVPTLIPMPG